MLLLLAIILFVAWILGFAAFHVAGGLIHLLLIFAVISLIWHLVTGRRATV
ncbi:MAG TPA: lmo0937 family membrane protein [Candidatus Angelobacter sp.]|nr:lmo0937 family membrane protein [Candidatus Angelobacter sp.]